MQKHTATAVPALMTEKELAIHCALSANYFKSLRDADRRRIERGEPIEGPAWVVIGSIVRYPREAVDSWLAARTSGAIARPARRRKSA